MTLELAKFRKIQKSGLHTWWSYVNHAETIRDIRARDYFASTRDRFAVGDWIFCTGSTGSVILHVDEINPLELRAPQA
tara:strand:+ start:6286 stop:6519 length:234 start_codon:yes stop_codon:yes gene_type:complete